MLLILGILFVLRKYLADSVSPPTSSSQHVTIFTRVDTTCDYSVNHRTVTSILWSCLATTFACTWVSVHPNMTFKNEGPWEIRGRRLFLMVFSILAPEATVTWAFKQWRGAVMIKEIVNKARPKRCMSYTCGIDNMFDVWVDDSAGVDDEARFLLSDGRFQARIFQKGR